MVQLEVQTKLPSELSSLSAPKVSTVDYTDIDPDFSSMRRMSGLMHFINHRWRTNENRQILIFTDNVQKTAQQLEVAILSRAHIGEEPLSIMEQLAVGMSLSTEEAMEAGAVVDRFSKQAQIPGEEWKDADSDMDLKAAHPARFTPQGICKIARLDFSAPETTDLARRVMNQSYFNGMYDSIMCGSAIKKNLGILTRPESGKVLIEDAYAPALAAPQQVAWIAQVPNSLFASDSKKDLLEALYLAGYDERRHCYDKAAEYLTKIPKCLYILPIEQYGEHRWNVNYANIHYRMAEHVYLQRPFNEWTKDLNERFSAMNEAAIANWGRSSFGEKHSFAEKLLLPQIEDVLEMFASYLNDAKPGSDDQTLMQKYNLTSEELSYIKSFERTPRK